MRKPNGYGSIYRLRGNRRKPWAVRKTVGWNFDKDRGKANPKYEFVGYYKTQKEALQALANYNEDPYDINVSSITFEDVYNKWSNIHFDKVSRSNITACKGAFKLCEPIKDMRINEIRLEHLQRIVDTSGKNTPTLKKLKIMLGLMYDYAVMNDITTPDKRLKIKYLDISKPGNPNSLNRTKFKEKEIKKIWENVENDIYYSVILIMIYSGLRIGELLAIKKSDVNIEERYINIPKSKTKAGIRIVPIADKILPYVEYWMENDSDYLICSRDNKKISYDSFYNTYWKPILYKLDIKHTPHCTRYTCISKLVEAGVDDRVIKQIVGHQGKDVTEIVYTKISIETKLEAINKI